MVIENAKTVSLTSTDKVEGQPAKKKQKGPQVTVAERRPHKLRKVARAPARQKVPKSNTNQVWTSFLLTVATYFFMEIHLANWLILVNVLEVCTTSTCLHTRVLPNAAIEMSTDKL